MLNDVVLDEEYKQKYRDIREKANKSMEDESIKREAKRIVSVEIPRLRDSDVRSVLGVSSLFNFIERPERP